jgi:hypothetical protein
VNLYSENNVKSHCHKDYDADEGKDFTEVDAYAFR